MKRLLSFAIAALLLVGAVAASHIEIKSLRVEERVSRGDVLPVYVSAKVGDSRHTKIRVIMLDAPNVRTSGPFSDRSGFVRKTTVVGIPEDMEPGEHLVRVSVQDNDRKRTKHRWVLVD